MNAAGFSLPLRVESMMKVTPFCFISVKQKYSVAIYVAELQSWWISLDLPTILLQNRAEIWDLGRYDMRVFIARADAQSPLVLTSHGSAFKFNKNN